MKIFTVRNLLIAALLIINVPSQAEDIDLFVGNPPNPNEVPNVLIVLVWKVRGWKTADRKPVKNEDLWRELDALAARHQVVWKWVRGHAGHPENERADALANLGVEQVRAS